MKKILIFGLSGFIGSNLRKYLKSYKVYAFENKKKIPKSRNIIPVNFNLNSKENIKLFKNKIDIVINLTWFGIPNFTKKNNDFNINLNKKIVNFSNEINAKKVFFSGSCFEYDHKRLCLDEKSKVTNFNKLGITKIKIKKYAEKKLKKKLIWGRIFYVYGPNQRKNSLLSYGKSQLLQKKKITLKNPFYFNDFIHVNKVCEIIIKLIEKNYSGTINICSGRPQFNIDFVEKHLLTKVFFNWKNIKIFGFYGNRTKLDNII